MNNQNWSIPKADYWDRKLAIYLHDPLTKALRIPGHEERASDLLDTLGALSFPPKEAYLEADRLAAGLDRSQLPNYNTNKTKNGAIDFSKAPRLTHPTGKIKPALLLELPLELQDMNEEKMQRLENELKQFLNSHKSIGSRPDEGSLSDQFKGDPDGFAFARYLYVHLQLRNELAKHNVGGLGELWGRLPADTRQPDHSIWQHNGLVSALASCRELSESHQASLLVYSLTPVQEFISKARKLRDYWTGSVLLSWLAFAGIRAVIETLGPDHVLYPNLIDQPLVNEYCRERIATKQMADKFFPVNKAINASVASFPNKFVCLVPTGREAEYVAVIEASIRSSWLGLAHAVKELVKKQTTSLQAEPGYGYLDTIFQRQNGNYWEHQWAATPLLSRDEQELIRELLGKGGQTEGELSFLEQHLKFAEKTYGEKDKETEIRKQDGRSALYGLSHKLAQSALASIKSNRVDQRASEPGIKCDLYSEFEIVTCFPNENPKPKADRFWNALRSAWHSDADFSESERLCSISLIKRLAYTAVQDRYFSGLDPDTTLMLRLLRKTLQDSTFPSTTEMAAADFLDRAQQLRLITGDRERRALAQLLHDRQGEDRLAQQDRITEMADEDYRELKQKKLQQILRARNLTDQMRPLTDADSYYAILMMDGDKMGDLVNGATIAAQWQTVLHPDLLERMQNDDFDADYHRYWKQTLGWESPRRLSPALHAAISEALGDFALYGVSAIISQHRGRLIYAGGDDVCAVLPVSSVLSAAEEIAALYSAGFVRYHYQDGKIQCERLDASGPLAPLDMSHEPDKEKRIVKLAQHLGKGDKLTISAGINICHHKQPLTGALQRTHTLLDTYAKEQGGRNAVAIELNKRSGGGRVYVSNWGDAGTLKAFKAVGEALGKSESRDLSSSLAYRLQTFELGLLSILECTKDKTQRDQMLQQFILQQIKRSELKSDAPQALAENVAQLIQGKVDHSSGANKLQIEALIVAKFLGERQHTRQQQEQS